MSRAAQTFKQGNLTKAIKAVEKAGLKVQRAEVRQDGSIILDFNGTPIAMSGTVDDLDSELAEFEVRNGQGRSEGHRKGQGQRPDLLVRLARRAATIAASRLAGVYRLLQRAIEGRRTPDKSRFRFVVADLQGKR